MRSLHCFFVSACYAAVAQAAPVIRGVAMIDYDAAAWASLAADTGYPSPVLALTAYFDQAQSNARTPAELLSEPQDSPGYLGQTYLMNGATVTNQALRTTQPTAFDYTPGAFPDPLGVIGLGGVARFRVSGGGSLLFGDFTLRHDVARRIRGGSGWYLRGHIAPSAPAFDLLRVQVVEEPDSFTITGDLSISFEVANLLFATPADTLRQVGNFRFTGYTTAVQPPTLTRLERQGDALVLHGSHGIPGGAFTLESAGQLSGLVAAWTEEFTGHFDAQGACQVTVPFEEAEPARWFRLQQP